MASGSAVRKVPLDQVIADLRSIPEAQFTRDNVSQCLTGVLLEPDSMQNFLHFRNGAYTRNLVYRNDLFEALVLCWDSGQKTPIHNHRGQVGWMLVYQGMLSILNYRRINCSGACHLDRRWTNIKLESTIPIAGPGFVSHVTIEDTIHQIVNDEAFGQPAVSLHVYSRPFDSCVIYDAETQICCDRKLSNHSEYGQIIQPPTAPAPIQV